MRLAEVRMNGTSGFNLFYMCKARNPTCMPIFYKQQVGHKY